MLRVQLHKKDDLKHYQPVVRFPNPLLKSGGDLVYQPSARIPSRRKLAKKMFPDLLGLREHLLTDQKNQAEEELFWPQVYICR